MALSKLKTSRSRLLAIMLAVMVPIAAILSAAVWSNYRFTVAGIDRDYSLLTANYASRLRVWIRGTERALATAITSIGALADNADACAAAARAIVEQQPGYRALAVQFADARSCSYARGDVTLDRDRITRLEEAAAKSASFEAMGEVITTTRLYFETQPGDDIVFFSILPPKEGRGQAKALLLVSPEILNSIFAFGEPYQGSTIAAILPNNRIVAAEGVNAKDRDWWPAVTFGHEPKRWLAEGRDGVRRVFASRPVIDDSLYVLGSFDAQELARAWYQFLLLLTLPFLVIAALTIAFLRASDVYVIDWLKRLEQAARERSQLREAKVDLSEKMPTEVHSFATVFNHMADAEAARRMALESALDENQFLVRELHHRVKNSLQVIQSYLALERRTKTGEARETLIDAELRVQTLSLAYRTALANGTIAPINLNDFTAQLVQMISNSMLQRGQHATFERSVHASYLELERVIALSFLLADVFARASRSNAHFALTLKITEQDGDSILTVDADQRLTMPPEPRVNRGLLLQLGASPAKGMDERHVAAWRWPSDMQVSTQKRFTP